MNTPIPEKPATPPPLEAQKQIAEREARARAWWAEEASPAHTSRPGSKLSSKPSWYQLMMFPYPSAAGLHVGNLYAFTGNDILARWKRLEGYNVFQPIGFDAFGIHSENYAWKVGRHPADIIPENIAKFTDQLKQTGLMLDWTKTVDTTDPNYYKWTQWLFLELYKAGEVEQKEAPVNWCADCATVISNEQVEPNGDCERHPGTTVQTKLLKQWFFRTSTHAPELLAQVNNSDWSENTLTAQRQWIGETKGFNTLITLPNTPDPLTVFSPNSAPLCLAEALFLAPEHPSLDSHPQAPAWRQAAAKLSVVNRRKAADTPTAFQTGLTVAHPLSNHPIPVIVTDAVLPTDWQGSRFGGPTVFAADNRIMRAANINIAPLAEDVSISPSRQIKLDQSAQMAGALPTTNYRLSDWCISRQRYWGPPIPIVHCDDCGPVPVPETDLPVRLPDLALSEILPDGSGQSPLARAEDWVKCSCPNCHKPAKRETDVSDTFLDSAWYFLRYPSANYARAPFESAQSAKWLPPDMYIGGNEHAVLHLLYARYITLMLHKQGHIPSSMPFKKFRSHGLITKDGFKMSKNRGNIVNPDEYIATWGADVLRTYLMYLGPFAQGGDFREGGIAGVYRFFERLRLATETALPGEGDPAVRQAISVAHQEVRRHIEALEYNTSIAALMEAMNILRANNRPVYQGEVIPLLKLTAPFAPHLAEDLWCRVLGHQKSIFESGPVQTDPIIEAASFMELPVQVNGRTRGSVSISKTAAEQEVKAALLAHPSYQNLGDWKKLVYVPGRIVNIVVPVQKSPTR